MSDTVCAQVVNGHTFTVSPRYDLSEGKILGKGSFGIVTTAFDKERQTTIAIKRIRPYANDEWDARHTLREIRLMRLLAPHPNVLSLFDVSSYDPKTELYLMMEVCLCSFLHMSSIGDSLCAHYPPPQKNTHPPHNPPSCS